MNYTLLTLVVIVLFTGWFLYFRRMFAESLEMGTVFAAGLAGMIASSVVSAWTVGELWFRYALLGVWGVGLIVGIGILLADRISSGEIGA